MTKTSRKNGAMMRLNQANEEKIDLLEATIKRLLVLNASSRRDLGPGFSHDGDRDNWAIAGYKKYNTITYNDYRQEYDRGLGGRIVDKWVQSTWQQPPAISEDGNTDTAFTNDVVSLATKFRLWETMSLADTHASIGEFGIILLGLNDMQIDDEGNVISQSPMSLPVQENSLNGVDDLLYLRPYGQNSVTNIKLNGDQSSPRFGLPEFYSINPDTVDSSGGTAISFGESQQLKVHWTRVLHLAENTLDNSVIGIPKMRRSLNVLQDILKMLVGSGEAYWAIADRGMIANIMSDVSISDDDFDAIADAVQDYYDKREKFLTLQNTDVKELSGQDVDPSGMFSVLEKVLAATSDIPNRIFFGSERGQLASGQDAKEWAAAIESRQETYAEPLIRDFLDRLTVYGVLPSPMGGIGAYNLGTLNEQGGYSWPSILVSDPKEEAEIRNINATALDTAQNALVNGVVMSGDEVRSFGSLDSTGETEDDMLQREDEIIEDPSLNEAIN